MLGRTDLPGFYPAVEQYHADVTPLASLGPDPLKEGRNPRRAPPSSAGPRQYSQAAFRTNGRPVTTGLRNPHIGVNDVSGDKDLGRVLEVYPFETPTEDRKIGGSTLPLATTKTAGHGPVTCVFVLLSDGRPLS